MKNIKYIILLIIGFTFSVNINAQYPNIDQKYYNPLSCQYGYYSYYPYECAPYGYYGSEWFFNGIFIGTAPWGNRRYFGYRPYRYILPVHRNPYYQIPNNHYGGIPRQNYGNINTTRNVQSPYHQPQHMQAPSYHGGNGGMHHR
jgi:hypothetical protein